MSSEREPTKLTAVIREKHRYEPIERREFNSTIPPHLLADLPEDERFMVNTVSKLENQFVWLSEGLLKNNGASLDLDDRVSTLETGQVAVAQHMVSIDAVKDKVEKLWDWKQFFSGKWAVLAALALVLTPVVLKYVVDWTMKFIKP